MRGARIFPTLHAPSERRRASTGTGSRYAAHQGGRGATGPTTIRGGFDPTGRGGKTCLCCELPHTPSSPPPEMIGPDAERSRRGRECNLWFSRYARELLHRSPLTTPDREAARPSTCPEREWRMSQDE